MTLESAEMVLVTGSDPEIYDFFSDRSVIIDWKNVVDDTLADFQRFLPEGFFVYEWPELDHVVMRAGDRTETISLAPKYPAIPLAEAARRLLPPEYEAFCIRDSLGSDTACYFVRPSAWWREFRAAYPERFELLFTEADHS